MTHFRYQDSWAKHGALQSARGNSGRGSWEQYNHSLLRVSPNHNRVSRLINALTDSQPLATSKITQELRGINAESVSRLLIEAAKDIAPYVGIPAITGGIMGVVAGSRVGGIDAAPDAMIGVTADLEVGNIIMAFFCIKMISTYTIKMLPEAGSAYYEACKVAWWGFEEGYDVMDNLAEKNAANRFADGHVIVVIGFLMGIVAYLTRGKGDFPSLLTSIRNSRRLGPAFADWVEKNKENLLKNSRLQERAPDMG